MKCRFCNEEMMDGVTICPACGGDNTQPAKKKWIPIVAAICCVTLVIGVVAMVIGFGFGENNRVTGKACYTEADDVVKRKTDVVVATAGDSELTNGELQVLYWSMVYDFVSFTGEYSTYFIDFTKPLSEQYYNEEEQLTWEHYFLETALATWLRYETLTAEAEKAGIVMDADLQSRLDGMYAEMEADLEKLGFDSVEELVHNDFGNAASFDDYMAYMDIYYRGNFYYNYLFDNLELTEAEIEDYYANNEASLSEAGYGKSAGKMVSARHILIEPADDTPEALDAAKKKAQDLMDQWVADGAKEETFAQLAKEHSSCSSSVNGGDLGAFTKGQMVKEFEEWCFADGLEYGDYGLVQTEFGWHIIFFVDGVELWYEASRTYLANDKLQAMVTEMEQKYPMTVDFRNIVLADVPLV